MRSVSWSYSGISCTGQDEFALVNNRTPGAGVYPTGPCTIRGYQLKSWLGANTYAVLGKTQPWGDLITQKLYGPGDTGAVFYPAGLGFHWNPPQNIPVQAGDGTDQLHLHYMAPSSEPNPNLELTIYYTLDSDSAP